MIAKDLIIAALIGALAGSVAPPSAVARHFTRPAISKSIYKPERLTYVAPVRNTGAATVKVMMPNGFGSGVAIGGGSIVTAAHVVGDAKQAKIKTRDGSEVDADVLWANKDYDVALLRTSANIPAAVLDCHTARVGDSVMAIGNPLGMEFISSFGKIAGSPREMAPNWKSVFVADITVIMGNSGGPVFSATSDKVVGIVVGVIGVPGGADSRSYLGLSTVVPSAAVCQLMGRAAA